MNPPVGNTIGCLIGIQDCANEHTWVGRPHIHALQDAMPFMVANRCSRVTITNGYDTPSPPTSILMEGCLSTFHVEVSNTWRLGASSCGLLSIQIE
jgi:hypothetical protein